MLKLFLQSLQRCLFRPLREPLRFVRRLLQCGQAGWLPAEFFLGSTCSMWEKWLYDLTKSHFQAPETERSLVASLRLASHSGFFFSRIPDHSAANHGIDNFPICHEPPAGDI